MTKRIIKRKAFDSSGDLESDESFSPSFTLGEYEVEEVSLGKAAKLLRESGRRGSKSRSAVDGGLETDKNAGDVPKWRNPLNHQNPGYEVEELQSTSLETWMSKKASQEQGDRES